MLEVKEKLTKDNELKEFEKLMLEVAELSPEKRTRVCDCVHGLLLGLACSKKVS